MLVIFRLLGIKEYLSSRLVCHQWKVIIDEPTTIYSRYMSYDQYMSEIRAIEESSSSTPRVLNLEAMPCYYCYLFTTDGRKAITPPLRR
ncbi:MAG: F-box protein [Rhabdochlamydiaceae bacterium]